jgi:protocatechuate 3,4-dioxygenase beta subunit
MKTDRKNFLRLATLAGASALLPFRKALASPSPSGAAGATGSCVLVPSEVAGPYPLDLTTNPFYFRQDIREGKPGVQMNLRMRILGVDNCLPMQNLQVNIWQNDAGGLYSGYDNALNPGQTGLTYLRGYQITDANGEVEFITILPGWYPGRTCHIHFRVFVSSMYAAISQLTFDHSIKNDIYLANPTLYTKGVDPVAPGSDGSFSDGYAFQLASLTPNPTTGGYDSFLELSIQGAGTVGVGHLERQMAKQFVMGQNFPNPFNEETTIPFTLKFPSDVSIHIWDLSGKKMASILKQGLSAGDHEVPINLNTLGLASAGYACELEVVNLNGTFRDTRMLTVAR